MKCSTETTGDSVQGVVERRGGISVYSIWTTWDVVAAGGQGLVPHSESGKGIDGTDESTEAEGGAGRGTGQETDTVLIVVVTDDSRTAIWIGGIECNSQDRVRVGKGDELEDGDAGTWTEVENNVT